MPSLTIRIPYDVADLLLQALHNAMMEYESGKIKKDIETQQKKILDKQPHMRLKLSLIALYRRMCHRNAAKIVFLYKDILTKKGRKGLEKTWTERQRNIAFGMLYEHPEISFKTWCDAVRWFTEDNFFGPHMNRIDVVANNFHRFVQEQRQTDKIIDVYDKLAKE